jgi:ribosomal protein S18 acetylase RimI-like enzyme
MALVVRGFEKEDLGRVLELSIAAWEPVFESFRHLLGEQLYYLAFPDWRESQPRAVRSICLSDETEVWVGVRDGLIAGFLATRLDLASEPLAGEIEMIAVDPSYQRSGVATELMEHAIQRFHDTGVRLVTITTGGDRGHDPARGLYEKAGFRALPLMRYHRRP